MARIVSIVEGHGETRAVPVLLRRIAEVMAPGVPHDLGNAIRVGRRSVLKPGELERVVELAARQAGTAGRILVLLDADRDCPAELAPGVRKRAVRARGDREIRVVFAKTEYEAWFLAAADSLAGVRGIREDATPPADPESVRDAKGWLTAHMAPGRSYRETVDQPALSASFDLERARQRAPSFDKLWRDVAELLR